MAGNYLTKRQQEIAIFRYGVISDIVNGSQMSPKERCHLIHQKSQRKWQIPYSEKTSISVGTIYRWIRLYQSGRCQLEALSPGSRSDLSRNRVWDEETANAVIQFRRQHPNLTVVDLIERMTREQLATPGIDLKPTTVYRFLHARGLMKALPRQPEDRRRFEAQLPNDLWQSDVMHGPRVTHDGKQRKSYLIALIDDHSRLIPYARFYLSEGISSYLDALYHAVLRRGLPKKLYVDNGSAFRSHKLQYVSASLGINLIHATPYQPQGKGKIERWFKTVRGMFLSGCQARSLSDLNDAFVLWLEETYHQRIHSGTGQKPLDRFTDGMHCIRSAPDHLMDYFRSVSLRKVNNDRTVVIDGRLFEAPVDLVGCRIELHYHDSDPDHVEAIWRGQSYGILQPVSVHVNCRVKRDKNNNPAMDIHPSGHYGGGTLFESQSEC